jgi:TonB family protein
VVLGRRPLGPAEARGILVPVVDALSYIHSKGFVHTRIKPANIMAEEDLLKISSDGLCRIGESSGAAGKPSAYDPPEAAGGRISPAGDVWSLGMTLCEALTQRLASWERTNQAEPALPSGLPAEFADIARHCLRRDPQLRWSIADIATRLNPNPAAAPKQILPNSQSSFDARRYVLPAVIALLLLALILTAARMFLHHPQAPARTSAVIERPALDPNLLPAPAKPDPKAAATKPTAPPPVIPIPKPPQQSAPPAAKPVPQVQQPPAKKPIEQAPPPSAPVSSPVPASVATTNSATAPGVVHGKVLQQVLPNAAQSARDTIRGTVRVSVKVQVDESGAVTQATIDSRGPSQFFADRAVHAAQLWKFSPARQDGRAVPSEWLIHFEIDPAAINVHTTETAP